MRNSREICVGREFYDLQVTVDGNIRWEGDGGKGEHSWLDGKFQWWQGDREWHRSVCARCSSVDFRSSYTSRTRDDWNQKVLDSKTLE